MRRDASVFYRHLAASVRAGIPLAQALPLAAAGCRDPVVRKAGEAAARRVQAGGPLAPALAAHPEAFSEVDVALVAVGEEQGLLEPNLERLAARGEAGYHARRRFALALAYPAFLLCAALLLPPLFLWVTRSFGAYARAVLGTALPFAVGLGSAAAVVTLFRERAPEAFDRALLSLPVLGGNLKKLALARFGESLAALYAGGVEIRKGLRLAVRAMGNRWLEARCRGMAGVVERGGGLADALDSVGIFPSEMVGAVAVGERTGELDGALNAFARLAQEEADRAIRALLIAIPVLVYLLVALYVAIVVISAFGAYFRTLGSF